jgi:hypothetical protein
VKRYPFEPVAHRPETAQACLLSFELFSIAFTDRAIPWSCEESIAYRLLICRSSALSHSAFSSAVICSQRLAIDLSAREGTSVHILAGASKFVDAGI